MAIPSTAKAVPGTFDPVDWRPVRIGVKNLLDIDGNERIDAATFDQIMSPEGAALGVQIDDTGARAPEVIEAGTAVRLYLSVLEEFQNHLAFDAGVRVPIKLRFQTTADPFNRFERTIVVTFVNR